MGTGNNLVTLYSPQAEIVWETVLNEGTAYSRREYVKKKYEDCADLFLAAYDAYIREAEQIVPRPDDMAYPYWAFASMDHVDKSGGGRVMELTVPVTEAVFFDQYDWYKVLRLSYIGETAADEEAFARKLQMRGIRDSSEAVLKPFYPDIKREIVGSWKRLFRYNDIVRAAISEASAAESGNADISTEPPAETPAMIPAEIPGIRAVQAGLWQIRKEWLCK